MHYPIAFEDSFDFGLYSLAFADNIYIYTIQKKMNP